MSCFLINPSFLRGLSNFGPIAQRGLSSLSTLQFSKSGSSSINQHQYMNNNVLFTNRNKSLIPTTSMSVLQYQPKRFSSDGDHVKLWTAEKVVSAGLVGIFPLAFIVPNPILDALLAFAVTIHSHWGIEAIVVDYVRPVLFGETIPKIGIALVYALSALTLGGLLYFIYTDVGIVNAVKLLWKL